MDTSGVPAAGRVSHDVARTGLESVGAPSPTKIPQTRSLEYLAQSGSTRPNTPPSAGRTRVERPSARSSESFALPPRPAHELAAQQRTLEHDLCQCSASSRLAASPRSRHRDCSAAVDWSGGRLGCVIISRGLVRLRAALLGLSGSSGGLELNVRRCAGSRCAGATPRPRRQA